LRFSYNMLRYIHMLASFIKAKSELRSKVKEMKGIIVSRSYIKLEKDGIEFWIGANHIPRLQKAISLHKRMNRTHQGGIKTITLQEEPMSEDEFLGLHVAEA